MVERSLSMLEARGSIPRISNLHVTSDLAGAVVRRPSEILPTSTATTFSTVRAHFRKKSRQSCHPCSRWGGSGTLTTPAGSLRCPCAGQAPRTWVQSGEASSRGRRGHDSGGLAHGVIKVDQRCLISHDFPLFSDAGQQPITDDQRNFVTSQTSTA
jgi:hypothetical protein